MSAPKHRDPQPRQILAKQAAALRAEGLYGAQIAKRLRISTSYAYELLSDPTGEKARRRKERYCGMCVDCGGRTNAGGGPPPERCDVCWRRYTTVWTRDAVITAVRAWADEHGGIPPGAEDWNPQQAIAQGRPEKADKFYEDDAWPLTGTVQRVFGSWNDAIRAAGFDPRRPGHYGREGEDIADRYDLVAMYERGMSLSQIAADLGVSTKAVSGGLKKQGAVLRSHRQAVQMDWARRKAA